MQTRVSGWFIRRPQPGWRGKRTLFTLLGLCALLFSTACGGRLGGEGTAQPRQLTATPASTRTPTPAPTATPVIVSGTVVIWHSWEDAQMPALLRQIDDFQRRYPDVQFDVTYVPELDLRGAFEFASIEGRAPSLLIAPAEWGPTLYDKGWVLDLSDLAGADLLNRLNPAAAAQGSYRNARFGLPVTLEGVVLYRNSRLIPISPPTFDELVELSKRLEGGEEVGAYLDRSFFFGAGHLYGLGGSLMDAQGLPAFNNEFGLAWLNLLNGFIQAGPADFFTDADTQLFKEGRAGFLIEHSRRRSELAEAIGSANLAIDPWPVHQTGSLAGFVQAEMLYLTPRSLNEAHQVSWLFLQELLSPEAQSALAEGGSIPSINGSPAAGAAAALQIDDPLIEQAMLALVDGVPYPVVPEMLAYPAALEGAMRAFFDEGLPAAEALRQADEAIRAAIAALRATPSPAP